MTTQSAENPHVLKVWVLSHASTRDVGRVLSVHSSEEGLKAAMNAFADSPRDVTWTEESYILTEEMCLLP